VTANTLTATITIIDTATDTLVAVLPCSAGCHGVNFGAKKGGGYYAYVSSKFSNDLSSSISMVQHRPLSVTSSSRHPARL
jgi:hypothetical protein